MISKIALGEFKAILLKDYGYSVKDEIIIQLATDFLISLEAVLSNSKVDKRTERSKSNG